MSCLIIEAHLHAGRFHGLTTNGRAEWPPSPARLFQAFVAAAAQGSTLRKEDGEALTSLEGQKAPIIAAPAGWAGQPFSHFMPNNDLDAKGGDPRRIGEIRSATKRYHPTLFDAGTPILYVWPFKGTDAHASRICEIAEQVYQLGRGVDMAWATAEIISDGEAEARLEAYPAAVYRPSTHGTGEVLACPTPGTLESLIRRYEEGQRRFKVRTVPAPTRKEPERRKIEGQTFAQSAKPRFAPVAYNCSPARLLYELHDGTSGARFRTWLLRRIVGLVETIRNDCAARLEESLQQASPDQAKPVRRVFGLCRDATESAKACRIRIIPLPSIGHPHADRGIRRILVEVPPACPLSAQDVDWAFASFVDYDKSTGEIRWMLTRAEDQTMLRNYGIIDDESGFRIWRTVTPMALSPERPHGRSNGTQRASIEAHAASAVVRALHHAGVTQKPSAIRVQREPFYGKGALAHDFAAETRFDARRLWHVELTFPKPVPGPLLAGNGRYLGLGLMAPTLQVEGIVAFSIVGGLTAKADPLLVARALRRAVMARVQAVIGKRKRIPLFFTGHELDGTVARRGGRSHLAFVCDKPRNRVLILAPHVMERRGPSNEERGHLATLSLSLQNMNILRAGTAGLISLTQTVVEVESDPLLAPATRWATQTPYQPTRHGKSPDRQRAIADDVIAELLRRGFPKPADVSLRSISVGQRDGVSAAVSIAFETAVRGPLALGRSGNLGGGLFAVDIPSQSTASGA